MAKSKYHTHFNMLYNKLLFSLTFINMIIDYCVSNIPYKIREMGLRGLWVSVIEHHNVTNRGFYLRAHIVIFALIPSTWFLHNHI